MSWSELTANARRGVMTALLCGLLLLGGSAAVVLAQSPDVSPTPNPTTQSEQGSDTESETPRTDGRDCPDKDGADTDATSDSTSSTS